MEAKLRKQMEMLMISITREVNEIKEIQAYLRFREQLLSSV